MKLIGENTPAKRTRRRLILTIGAMALYCFLVVIIYRLLPASVGSSRTEIAVVVGATPPVRNVFARGEDLYVDGEQFIVKSVGWDPVRPGELPWTRRFHADEVNADLQRVRDAGFNTIRTWAALKPEELALVERHGLRVLQGIWVDPAGDFAGAAFRRTAVEEVRRAVETSRWSPAVLGYLVMNEPRAGAVARAGIDDTVSFLREVVSTVRALDPSALIGFANWPGMEVLDDDLFDFVAFNIYDHRPRFVMQELGVRGYSMMLRETLADGRPMIVTEFGVSVSPVSAFGRGRATHDDQSAVLCQMLGEFLRAGAAGTSVFQWSDGWWKDAEVEGDERSHEPDDPEEWFGLVQYASLDDRLGTPRPALEALRKRQMVLLLHPGEIPDSTETIEARLYGRDEGQLMVQVEDHQPIHVPLVQESHHWRRGEFPLSGPGPFNLLFEYRSNNEGTLWRQQGFVVRAGQPRLRLTLEPSVSQVPSGESLVMTVSATGLLSMSPVIVTTYAEDRYHEDRIVVALDGKGRGTVRLQAPDGPTIMTVVAMSADTRVPPELRGASWACVEVSTKR